MIDYQRVEVEYMKGPRKGQRTWVTQCWGGYSLTEADGSLALIPHNGLVRQINYQNLVDLTWVA